MQFVQVKLATQDPNRLVSFYVEALDCLVVQPEVELEPAAGHGAGAPDQRITITVLTFPGVAEGPNLELITGTGIEPGGGMLTFYVDDVASAAQRVVAAGGRHLGEIIEFEGPNGGEFRFVFMTDPDGNVVDLFQSAD